MTYIFAKLALGAWKYLFHPVVRKTSLGKKILRKLSSQELCYRLAIKKRNSKPINVLFVCHEPSLWRMFDSLYQALDDDQGFCSSIITLPYKHASDSAVAIRDGGMSEFLDEKGIPYITGYDSTSGKWRRIEEFHPDYLFFQTPYGLFPRKWSVEHISLHAKICYIPYGTTLFCGAVEEVVHPASFFKYVDIIFKESEFVEKQFVKKFENYTWFDSRAVRVGGHPKLDGLFDGLEVTGKVWPRGGEPSIQRILWTPRWTTSEGACHFFDYKNFFYEFCNAHQKVDFTFRPHPLCLKNFVSNKEMTEEEVAQMRDQYMASPNMVVDEGGDYRDTFLSCDILISDLSSMMLEYLGTGKPIIYTHRVDLFNDLGRELSKGIYWVHDQDELHNTLEMLLGGSDSLYPIRQGLIKSLLFLPEGGAGVCIREAIREDVLRLSQH